MENANAIPADKADVKITSIWTKNPPARPDNFEYTVRVDRGENPDATLSAAFLMTNMEDRPNRTKVCSTSCGDILELDGEFYLVEDMGFAKLTAAEAAKVKTLTIRETTFGLEDMKKNKLI